MENSEKYWDGPKNKAIRYYFYVQKGLELLNEFRYLIMSIFAIYYALKLTNIWLIPIMFLLAIPALTLFGWLSVHHMRKVMEYLGIEFATHWARYTYELQEKQIKLLEQLNEKLEKK